MGRHLLRVGGVVVAMAILAAAVYVSAWIAPGVSVEDAGAAVAVAVVVAALGAVLPPLVAALPLPYTFPLGFVLVLTLDAAILLAAAEVLPDAITVDSVWAALLASVLLAACALVLSMLVGVDEQAMALRVLRRVARRQGVIERGSVPGIVFLEIDGLAFPVLQRAMRSGHAPNLARWLEQDGHVLLEWETDLSSQTGASQAGILLGSNADIPAFRWVQKKDRRVVTCSSPKDCAEIERAHAGSGLLAGGGASRGNLLSGEADEVILTVSRMEEERRANPGYRAFLANGSNVTRSLALFVWEIAIELLAATRQRRRDIRPRGHRGGVYPLLRATLCVLIRDLTVFGVMTDLMRGRPAVYATFPSYDEVAHHSGLERPDTLEALRKLDERLGRIARVAALAPRPYELVVLSDHGQTQGATFRQRNGYGLDDLVASWHSTGAVAATAEGDEQRAMVGHALHEAAGHAAESTEEQPPATRDVVVLASGNLGLIYLMDAAHRLTREEIDARHPALLPALRDHPDIGWVLVRSRVEGPVVLSRSGSVRLWDGAVEGEDPLRAFGPHAASHLLRTDGFAHVPDILVGSFYDPEREEGCAFEELISFHGGLGGPQTRGFILHPPALAAPSEPLVGAEAVHRLLVSWREALQGPFRPEGDALRRLTLVPTSDQTLEELP
jgi:uncharacterized membrane protein YvlD (DUF360 family)